MYIIRQSKSTSQSAENKKQFNLKKNNDQRAFIPSCTKYIVNARLLPFSLYIIYEETPIRIYKIVQIIGNKNPGGAKEGLLILV